MIRANKIGCQAYPDNISIVFNSFHLPRKVSVSMCKQQNAHTLQNRIFLCCNSRQFIELCAPKEAPKLRKFGPSSLKQLDSDVFPVLEPDNSCCLDQLHLPMVGAGEFLDTWKYPRNESRQLVDN